MNKFSVSFEESDVSIEIDGVEYPIPPRSARLEKLIAEREKRLADVSELDGNIDILVILLGVEAVVNIFPNGAESCLDKLAKVAFYAIKAYNTDKEKLEMERINDKLDPITQKLDSVAKSLGSVRDIAAPQNREQRRFGK